MSTLGEDDLRALVREAIGRLRIRSDAGAGTLQGSGPTDAPHPHASHLLFRLGPGGDDTGACVIEPAVRCTHCGYCQSYGH